MPATPPTAPREKDPARFKKNLARSCTSDGSAAIVVPLTGGTTAAGASEIARAWETATVSTPSCLSRLARRLPSFDRKWSEEGGDRVTANGHDDFPSEQGIANAVDEIGSGHKTTTGHVESGLDETGIDPRIKTGVPESESERDATGSGPKTATDLAATARGRTATETRTASDALDR